MGESVLGVTDALLGRVAEEVGTPVFVYSADAIRERHAALASALAGTPHHIHYAVKANSNLAVLRLIRDLGAGADIVSGGELARVLRAGFPGKRIVFSGVGKSADELRTAVREQVSVINLESVEEFDVLRRVTRKPVQVGIRVNPDITTETHPYTQTGQRGMKFGVPLDQVSGLACAVRDAGCHLSSIGVHLGSQITEIGAYERGAERLIGLVAGLRREGCGAALASVDLGGGFGVRYTDERAFDLAAFAPIAHDLHGRTGLDVLIEPGRFLVGNAGVLLTRVLYRKHSGGRDFVIVDSGMNDFLRPALYQARHHIHVVGADGTGGEAEVDVVGPNCESGDFLALGYALEPVAPGGLLCVRGAGAYGFVMSSNYNSRTRAAEVVVDHGRFGVVRTRETVDRLWEGESAEPAWVSE